MSSKEQILLLIREVREHRSKKEAVNNKKKCGMVRVLIPHQGIHTRTHTHIQNIFEFFCQN